MTSSILAKYRPPGYILATCFVSIAGLLNGYDTGSIGAVTEMPQFETTFGHLSPGLRGLTVSIVMLAGVFPSFYAGQLADRFGRLSVISAGAAILTIGCLLQASASRLPVFILGRALSGVGQGTWMSALAVYITEIAPSARRGMLVSAPQLMSTTGVCVGYFTCYASIRLPSSLAWRATFIIQAILGLVLAVGCYFLPQSPRWLLLNNQRDKAVHAIQRLDFGAAEAEKDLLGPAATAAAELSMRARKPGPVESLLSLIHI